MFGLVLILLTVAFIEIGCGPSDPNPAGPQPPVIEEEETPVAQILVTPVISGEMPDSVPLPANDTLSAEENRPFFDEFSWQTFIALCWPLETGQRGVPQNPEDSATFFGMTNNTPVVWTSYKNQYDLFGQGSDRPSSWESWANPNSLCNTGETMTHVFGTAKGNILVGDVDEAFSVPLIDQQKNYTLYEMRYNEPQYNFIRGSDSDSSSWLYIKSNLVQHQIMHHDTVEMPGSNPGTGEPGATLIKASWKYLTEADDSSRYYVIYEEVYDPVTKSCNKQKMGLVGLHIVRKVKNFSQWVWSSFEQVDNVPGAPKAQAPYTYNNNSDTPQTSRGYANKPDSTGVNPDKDSRVPVQVTRLNPVPTTPAGNSTVDINALYQEALGSSWMANYQLVITQWPTDESSFKLPLNGGVYPKDCGVPFPQDGCANTSMETYYQSQMDAGGVGGNSCMSCHYTAAQTDFSWSLQLRSQ